MFYILDLKPPSRYKYYARYKYTSSTDFFEYLDTFHIMHLKIARKLIKTFDIDYTHNLQHKKQNLVNFFISEKEIWSGF